MIESNHQVTIHQPIDVVMDLFNNQSNFKHWQRGLVDFENITSTVGQVGSKRKLRIKTPAGIISMNETITHRDLPHRWEATYRTKGVLNKQCNSFRESVTTTNGIPQKVTIWKSQASFKFTGMMRLVSKARPQLFENQTLQFMKDFKDFAENGTSVTSA
ncbi:SRPBCC family protein [Nonlabens ponticola]|uniref:SRPBCC family protein n=1 Tax=Nonlabens ponticola TaxID=2496866 RepID=A0A3S9N075_9FLAO|nr:SRPBCC family protein [Nonlabens ponticola]AZQ44901.1 SRPBCC family protein [Nonlabens ponticola]